MEPVSGKFCRIRIWYERCRRESLSGDNFGRVNIHIIHLPENIEIKVDMEEKSMIVWTSN